MKSGANPSADRRQFRPKVLVVETGLLGALVLRDLGVAGYEVLDARDPEEARAMAAAHDVDLLICGRTARTTAAAIRHDHRPDLGVVMLTGFASAKSPTEPGVVLLEKPFTRAELLAADEAALGVESERD
jgi:CheY-like chemotaxis protein